MKQDGTRSSCEGKEICAKYLGKKPNINKQFGRPRCRRVYESTEKIFMWCT